VKVIAKGLNLPNGIAFRTARSTSPRSSHHEDGGDRGQARQPAAMEVVYDTLPKDLPHGWKYLAFGPDGKLYFNIGAPCNICMPPDTHANLSRVNADGTGFEYWRTAVRNSVGFDWHPGPRSSTSPPRPRLAGRRLAERSARRGAEEGAALRLPVLPPGRHPRPGVRQGAVVREFSLRC
jgi:hypothetical protein